MKRFALIVLLVCASLSQAVVTNPVFRTSGLIVGNNTNRENGALRFLVPYGLQVFYGTTWSNVVGGSSMDYSNTVLNVLGLSLGYTTNAAPEGTLRFNPSTTTLQMYVRSAWTNVVLEDSTPSNSYDQVRTDVNELQTNTVDLVSDQTVAGNKTLTGVLTVSNNVNFGTQNTATGSWAAVLGGGLNDARGAQSVVVGGLDNEAAGAYSIAGGSGSFASGTLSMAVGDNVRAIGDRTVALGRRTRATNDGSFVFGDSQSNLKYDRHADSFNLFFDGGAHLYDTPLYLYDTASNTVVQLSSSGLVVGTNTFSIDSHGGVTATNVSLRFGSSTNETVAAARFTGDGTSISNVTDANAMPKSGGTFTGGVLSTESSFSTNELVTADYVSGVLGTRGATQSIVVINGVTKTATYDSTLRRMSNDFGSVAVTLTNAPFAAGKLIIATTDGGTSLYAAAESSAPYDHSHATNAFEPTKYAGTNLIIDRTMGPRIKFTATNNSQIGFSSDWGTNFEGTVKLTLDAGSYTLVWTPLVSLTATNFVTTNGTTVIMWDKSESATNWNGYQLSP